MKAHAVCLPFPAQSHIGAMLKLAKLLHHQIGLCITFVNTEFNHRRLLAARGASFTADLPAGSFQFAVIPDGLPPSEPNATQSLASLCEAARYHMAPPFCTLIGDLNSPASSGFPPVSLIVTDGVMKFSADPAGVKFGIPVVELYTVAASFLMVSMKDPLLKDRSFALLDRIGMAGEENRIPGMKNITLSDLPSSMGLPDPDNMILNLMRDVMERMGKASATIIHTFQALEADVMNAFSYMFDTPFYAIGPFHLLTAKIPAVDGGLNRIGCNLWKEDSECLRWLNLQEPRSVLYINFGSIASLTTQQLVEFAMGIAGSNHPFLWIIRPDLVTGSPAAMEALPPEFGEETKGRGFISEWCAQEEVLNHPSVGGFLTHCGWNSVLESLSAGVPMLCWPCGGDQVINSKYVCMEWEAGLEIDQDVKRHGVVSVVREMMGGGEKGKHLMNSAMAWKEKAMAAIGPLGSSSMNLDKLLQHVLSK
ncbi:hypothetical protein SAY87_009747 [Trapa incisa]|uniref:Glycosyltransferase n=1 Tax=Trapa incisa TaxID=236973 RepID=A0AAN7Q382_9MYRT|nr:hypothetical protein SAY87_009747 [Trapa incisa]